MDDESKISTQFQQQFVRIKRERIRRVLSVDRRSVRSRSRSLAASNPKDEEGEVVPARVPVNDFGMPEKSKYSTATKPVLLK